VPGEVIADQFALFVGRNYNLKVVIRSIFTSADFVRF
jgi:hypothetical protein